MLTLNFYTLSLFIGGFICLILSRYHLLVIILRLEFLMLAVYFSLILRIGGGINNCLLIMLYLFVMVCEARLGLGILVGLVKGYGADLCNILILLRC